jgi:hypothetical protein
MGCVKCWFLETRSSSASSFFVLYKLSLSAAVSGAAGGCTALGALALPLGIIPNVKITNLLNLNIGLKFFSSEDCTAPITALMVSKECSACQPIDAAETEALTWLYFGI